jgi:hypothetical protein
MNGSLTCGKQRPGNWSKGNCVPASSEDHLVQFSVFVLLPDVLDDLLDVRGTLGRVVVDHSMPHQLFGGKGQHSQTVPVQSHGADDGLGRSLADLVSLFVAHECDSERELETLCVH